MNSGDNGLEPTEGEFSDALGGVRKAIARAEAVQAETTKWSNKVEEHRRTLHAD